MKSALFLPVVILSALLLFVGCEDDDTEEFQEAATDSADEIQEVGESTRDVSSVSSSDDSDSD